jgi:hypothetical protein
MNLQVKNLATLDTLDQVLLDAQELSLGLLAKIIKGACTRIPRLAKPETFNRVIHFAEIGAWTDAAFALIALVLPLWRVRRLGYESGEWFCSLSRQPNLPMEFDDCIEAAHGLLPMAILRAFIEACRRRDTIREPTSVVPGIEARPEQIVCCDNYR